MKIRELYRPRNKKYLTVAAILLFALVRMVYHVILNKRRSDILVLNNLCIIPSIQDNQKRLVSYTFEEIPSYIIPWPWKIEFNQSGKVDLLVFKNVTAYFVTYTDPNNIHHFLLDTFNGFYSTSKYMNEIESEKHVYFNGFKVYLDRYGTLFFTALNVSQYSGLQDKSMNKISCYKKAVFGEIKEHLIPGEMESIVINNTFKTLSCLENQIIIHKRKSRTILNADDIVDFLKANGYPNTKAIDFADITIQNQLVVAACTKILIGVQGAGMEWFRFMRRPAGMIEIGWNHWPPFYSKYAELEGYVTLPISNCEAKLSNDVIEHYIEVNKFKKFTLNDKELLKEHLSNSSKVKFWYNSNIWKFANCIVLKETVLQHVKQVMSSLTEGHLNLLYFSKLL